MVVLNELVRQAQFLELIGPEGLCKETASIAKDLRDQDTNVT
jgi:hypothetical protein